jgi:glycosyltransferase involved in cell wall biosynthesis
MKKKIVYFKRKNFNGSYSIENVFNQIETHFKFKYYVINNINKYFSNQYLFLFYDIIKAYFKQGEINHITGDVNYISFLLNKRKTILTIHDCINLEISRGIKFYIFWLFWYWIPIKKSKYITVVSQTTKLNLLKYFKINEKKIKIIYNPIPNGYSKNIKVFNTICPAILIVGTTPNKNLINQITTLKGIHCKLTIIGKIDDETKLLLNKLKVNYNILFNLSDSEVINEFLNCDILLFASFYEGFGLPIIQAQAIGRVVITSNLSSMPEIAGKNACLVNPYDINEIKVAINKCINDKLYRDFLIANGFENIKRFEPNTIFHEYENLYDLILNSK